MKDLIQKIINEKFESVINGYSSFKVDSFLDSIIKELEELYDKHNQLIEEKNKLIEDKKLLEEKIKQLELNQILPSSNNMENNSLNDSKAEIDDNLDLSKNEIETM